MHTYSTYCTYVSVHAYTFVYMYTYTYTRIRIHIRLYKHVCIRIRIRICVCVCVLAIDFAQLDMWKLLQSHCPSSLTFDHFKPTFFNVRSSCHYVTWLMPSRNNFALIPPAPPPSRHPVTI